jgi:ParB family chromosome partitioning protein
MLIAIEKIKVAERIRNQTTKIDELAADIRKNGLINPITVMTANDGTRYQLLAGLRRLRAAQLLGWSHIESSVAQPKDAEAVLNIEYSENMQRETFTYSEKMDYARLIAEIEKQKAQERKQEGQILGGTKAGKGRPKQNSFVDDRPQSYERKPLVRDIIGEKIGMSGKQFYRANYIADHATPEIIDTLDRGERSINATYEELRAAGKKGEPIDVDVPIEQLRPTVAAPVVSISPAQSVKPVSDLDRAIHAEQELDALKYRQHNEIFHRDSIIENLKKRVLELEAALAEAQARILQLEAEKMNLTEGVVGHA